MEQDVQHSVRKTKASVIFKKTQNMKRCATARSSVSCEHIKISRCGERRCFEIGADDQAVIISLPNRTVPELYGYLGISVFTPCYRNYQPESQMSEVIDLTEAQYHQGYQLRLRFSDGTERLIDFEPFLRRSKHPQIQSYLNPDRFKQFQIVDGNLDWNDFELCFPLIDLYEGKV